ncbi:MULTISPECIES: phage holin [unclassified Oceanobacillus]|uniref:phage holin n=1 Tax=unclassified Oceanobacillus TaxID=2630292 RepID=UPI001BE6A7B5|nr:MULTISPECIES: phage holin [unclassified Oceanobacillus]MBT2599076.1 hypothetical protein [Oceanobacillus sp. ISL-74]MBT2651994.1 hypothetical protein [Oceanobacillus sp. ISL-73]
MKTQSQVNREVKQDATKGLIVQFTGILTALLPLLAITGVQFEWFNEDFIGALETFLLAIFAFGVNAFAIWKNNFSGKKAQEQNAELKSRGLK